MSINPLNELKRRLENADVPLPKRLCLAKNVVISHHFPTGPKEHLIGEWLQSLISENGLSSKQIKGIINWTNVADDFSSELKSKLIQIISQYVTKNNVQPDEVNNFISIIESPILTNQIRLQIEDYLQITLSLLKVFNTDTIKENTGLVQQILTNLTKTYKDCKRKLEFIYKFVTRDNLDTIFNYLDTECHTAVIETCKVILYPITKKPFFLRFLQTMLSQKGIEHLKAEQGDSMQSVSKIMNTFYKNTVEDITEDQKFSLNFIHTFVSCFKSESQLVFAFYLSLDGIINPAILLQMLKYLEKNEVDVSLKFTSGFSERVPLLEAKNTFMVFLHTVMIKQLNLCADSDIIKFELVKIALKLDPSIVLEKDIDLYLPNIMTTKKKSTTIESYSEFLIYLIEVLFKLSRGTTFLKQILPKLNQALERKNGNTDLKKKNKMVTGNDVFPEVCVEEFGKWTSELMFRQNKDFLVSLQSDFEVYCLAIMQEGSVDSTTLTLTEVMSAILSSVFRHSKMADHTVPVQVAEEFWEAYERFEEESLKKFGECLLKVGHNATLHRSFLRLSTSCLKLKLLNTKYSNTKVTFGPHTSAVHDLSDVLPCLDSAQWTTICGIDENCDELNDLLLLKAMFLELQPSDEHKVNTLKAIKTHLVKQTSSEINILKNEFYTKVLFTKLDKKQARLLTEIIIKMKMDNPELNITENNSLVNNRTILNALVIETCRNLIKCFENTEKLTKALKKNDFDITSFSKEVDLKDVFTQITMKENQDDLINVLLEVLKELPISYLEESFQLVTVFLLLATKKCCHKKKAKKTVDGILHTIFEVSSKCPDVYKLFPVEFIFSFQDGVVLNLLILKNKVSNNMFVIKKILESGVKKVKTEPEIVNNIVEILLEKQPNKTDHSTNIEYFSELPFQITCIILPIIVKEKKGITTSAFRSILAALQEKLHQAMLEAFQNTDFKNSSFSGSVDESMVENDYAMATLSAMGAFTLTLSKYCETTDALEIKKLDCLWNGLDFFLQTSLKTLQTSTSKPRHVESSIQLLNTILRHIKKLETHEVFNEKNKIHLQIWKAVLQRVNLDVNKEKYMNCIDELSITLKFVSELISIEAFVDTMVLDLTGLFELKNPTDSTNQELTQTSLKSAKYIFSQSLKANIVGKKCNALSRLVYKICKDFKDWFDNAKNQNNKCTKIVDVNGELQITGRMNEEVCGVTRIVLDCLAEGILAAKKITLDYKVLDSIFDLLHYVGSHLASPTVDWGTWDGFLSLFEGLVAVLNSLLVSREELLEDRWPCYLQAYRVLVRALASAKDERGMPEAAHSVEKLTQSICKRKTHVSRIAAYIVADICSSLEKNAPSRVVRQHLENSVALFIQVSDANNAMTFLRRVLAGNAGQMTMTNLYTMYKRYHKYVGNS